MTRWLALPLALLLWLALTALEVQPRVDRWLGDALLRWTAPAAQAEGTVRVDIDDASLRELRQTLGDWPYPREIYALWLDYLRECGVRLVVLDIVLAGPRDGDARLADALGRGPPVVLAAAGLPARAGVIEADAVLRSEREAVERLGRPGPNGAAVPWAALTLPADNLLAVLPGPGALGLISAPLDDDGLLRRLPLLHEVQGRQLPGLALAAWLRERGLDRWEPRRGELQAGATAWPTDGQGRVLLRLPRADTQAPTLPWRRLMAAALGQREDPELARLLRGQRVYLGSSAFFADQVSTPQGRFSGAAFHAAVGEALERGLVLRESPVASLLVQGLWLLLAALPAWIWCQGRVRLRRLAAASLLVGVGLVASPVGLVTLAGLWVLPLPALYTLVGGLGVALLARVRWDQQHERELVRERELAETASRAKTELLAQVSHEMRTPMNAVLGLADILARSPLGPREAHYVEVLGHAGRQVFDLINDLLDNARLQGGQLELAPHAFDLVDLVELQLELLRPRAQEKGLYLRVFAELAATGRVVGDSRRVAQILTNLVGNALKFTQTGGVTVQLSRQSEGRVCIAVQDTGMGIAPEQLERIFTPFAQAHAAIARDFGGTGLGLAISRSLARLMGGDLRAQSQPGQGSLFEVTLDLPAAPDEPGVDSRLPGEARSAAPERPLRLLLAEDNEVNAMVIQAMLEPLGHQITRAADGLQALEWLRRERFDGVLMDMEMPEMDGLTATRTWRDIERAEGRARLPVLALTANAFDADVRACLEAGCDAHVAKPISVAALLQALAQQVR